MKRLALLTVLGLVLTACLGSDFESSVEGNWLLDRGTATAGEIPILDSHPINMNLDQGEISGTAACNRYFGEYRLDGSAFSLGDGVAVTEMACLPEEVMISERAFLDALTVVDTAELTNDELRLTGADVELVFVAGPDLPSASDDGVEDPEQPVSTSNLFRSDVRGAWELVSGTSDGNEVPMVASHPITLTVETDWVGGTAACNNYGVEIPIEGDQLVLSWTEMACFPETVMISEQAYLSALMRIDSSTLEAGELVLRGDGVELRYTPLPPVPTADLIGTVWVLDGLITGEAITSVAGERATLELFSDSSFIGSTGCRTISGTYQITGAEVVFTTWGAEGECPDEMSEQDSRVISALEGGFRVEIEGNRMTTWVAGDEGLTYRAES